MTEGDRRAARYSARCRRQREARTERLLAFSVLFFILALAVKVGTLL